MTERRTRYWPRLLSAAETTDPSQRLPEPAAEVLALRTLDGIANELRQVQNKLVDHDVEGIRLLDTERRLQLQLAAQLKDYGLVATIVTDRRQLGTTGED